MLKHFNISKASTAYKPKPKSQSDHSFEKSIFPTPKKCQLCEKVVWGIECDGRICKKCGFVCHNECLCKAGDLPCAAASSSATESKDVEMAVNEEAADFGTTQRRTLGKDDTLMRLSRRKYMTTDNHSKSAIISTTLESTAESKTPVPVRLAPESHSYVRRIHGFRGHEFQASFLETSAYCSKCEMLLAANGKQCYQCRLCQITTHKKCYPLTKPCPSTTILPYLNTINEREYFSIRNVYDEDFSDELIEMGGKGNNIAPGGDFSKFELDDYVFDNAVIGAGQYGVVKKGHYKANPKISVAVKIIDKKKFMFRKKEVPLILKRELDILKKLDHPGIIRMHHCIDTPTHTFVIMDCATNGDLLDYIMTNGKIEEAKCKLLLKQVVNALLYLHSNGIVHRDLKPENILLSNNYMTAQIADFGFARMVEMNKCVTSIVGTPAYMAPEIVDSRIYQYTNRNGYDSSCDMWSLGVVLYVALGGVFPFDSQQSILDQILRGEFFFPDEYFGGVSDEGVDACCRLLSVDPSKRMDCEACLRHIWFQ